ncbi:MAG TPA: arsenate reductase (glutaredoxin) [Acidimicrobiia bacterium]|nr:arsenate reductase (glutaredoxin) [Acidimicrobiia bacterium]
MPKPVLYHNPRCSKSRSAYELLETRGVDVDVVKYLDTAPDRADLERIVDGLRSPPAALVRKDARFKELGLTASDYVTRDSVVAVLSDHPELMERPVVVVGDRAVIGRPPERVLELVDEESS